MLYRVVYRETDDVHLPVRVSLPGINRHYCIAEMAPGQCELLILLELQP